MHTKKQFLLKAAVGLALVATAGVALSGGLTPDGTQPPLNHPIQPPGNCQICHGDFAVGNHEPWATWAGSMMANATRDPLFWAALDVANNDLLNAGDFCLRCHAPTAWLAGRSEPPGGSTDGCGLIGNLDESNNDFAGVSCHFCHRMQVNSSPPPGEESVYYENGKAWIDDGDCSFPGSGPCRRGPYDYAMGGTPPPHEWAFSQYHVDSDLCGNCHNVTSPVLTLIDEGVDTGVPFPIERTFTEWLSSDYAPGGAAEQGCQDCHMDQADGSELYVCAQETNDRAGDLATHRFAGGNAWVPEVLQGEYPEFGRFGEFNATIAWALDMLQNRSATVAIDSLRSSSTAGATLDAEVRVTNLTGHKLPTGYPEGRRMWLNLVARDGLGDVVFESAAYDLGTGDLTEDAQAKIYRVEPGIWNQNGTDACDIVDGGGDPMFHFVLNNCIAIDNRIPPLGFTGGDDLELRPVAYTYPETFPGSGVLVNYDVTSYAIPIPPGTPDPVTVEATLYYQTASKEYVEFLRDEAVDNGFPDDCLPRTGGTPTMSRGEILHDMWTRYDRSPPVDMDSASQQLALAVFTDGFESGDTSVWDATVP